MDQRPDLEERLFRENIQLAKIEKRVLAHAIDDVILSIILFIIIAESISTAQSQAEMILLVNSFLFEFMFIKFIYHSVFTALYGGSLGKIIMKIKVVNTLDFGEISILDSLNRSFMRLFSEMIFWLGFLWGVFDPNKQSWHDKSAKTIVVDVSKK
jgi:uncharacterized RDD family membrane protein YckC